jgi:hypothetical protein
MHSEPDHSDPGIVRLPASTAWPVVLSLGIALLATGLVTSGFIGLLGLVLALFGAIGWFFQVLPHEHHFDIAVQTEEVQIVSTRTLMERLPTSDRHRKILPIETFQISTGIKGGIVGGVAMVIPATIFSLIRYHSIWYAGNLLAAGGFVSWANASDAFLGQFHIQGLLAAIAIHGFTSLLVGLLYGAMLPMYPRYPIVTAGIAVPLLFTGILHSALGIISPILNDRIDWFWFIASQIAFGLVCGFVVNLQARVRTPQFQALPFAVRAGLEGGVNPLRHEPDEKSDRKSGDEAE